MFAKTAWVFTLAVVFLLPAAIAVGGFWSAHPPAVSILLSLAAVAVGFFRLIVPPRIETRPMRFRKSVPGDSKKSAR